VAAVAVEVRSLEEVGRVDEHLSDPIFTGATWRRAPPRRHHAAGGSILPHAMMPAMSDPNPELAAAQQLESSSRLVSIFRRVSGPDATAQEAQVWLLGTLGITAVAAAVAVARSPGWSALQWVLAMGFAFDFGGGVITSATSAAKRSYHRPGRAGSRARFYAGHVHPLVLPLVFPVSWTAAVALYAGMLAAAALVELAPRAVAMPVAFAAVAVGLFLASGAGWPIGMEWFAPVYLLKLVGAYAVPPGPDGDLTRFP